MQCCAVLTAVDVVSLSTILTLHSAPLAVFRAFCDHVFGLTECFLEHVVLDSHQILSLA